MTTQSELRGQLFNVCDRATSVSRAVGDHVEPADRMTPEQIDTALESVVRCAENARDLWKDAPA